MSLAAYSPRPDDLQKNISFTVSTEVIQQLVSVISQWQASLDQLPFIVREVMTRIRNICPEYGWTNPQKEELALVIIDNRVLIYQTVRSEAEHEYLRQMTRNIIKNYYTLSRDPPVFSGKPSYVSLPSPPTEMTETEQKFVQSLTMNIQFHVEEDILLGLIRACDGVSFGLISLPTLVNRVMQAIGRVKATLQLASEQLQELALQAALALVLTGAGDQMALQLRDHIRNLVSVYYRLSNGDHIFGEIMIKGHCCVIV